MWPLGFCFFSSLPTWLGWAAFVASGVRVAVGELRLSLLEQLLSWEGRLLLPFQGHPPDCEATLTQSAHSSVAVLLWQLDMMLESNNKQPGGDGNSSCLLWKEMLKAKEQHCPGELPYEKQLKVHHHSETEVM